jgi:hypothetical protein
MAHQERAQKISRSLRISKRFFNTDSFTITRGWIIIPASFGFTPKIHFKSAPLFVSNRFTTHDKALAIQKL